MKHLLIILLALNLTGALLRAESALGFQPSDTVQAVLERQKGQVVQLSLRSGEKFGGKVEQVGSQLVHLTQLTGQEFYEAVVSFGDIAAVITRAKSK